MSTFCMIIVIPIIILESFTYGLTVKGDWELVLHAVSGKGENVMRAWQTKYKKECDLFNNNCRCSTKDGCLPFSYKWETIKECPRILRSVKIDYWKCLNIQKIKVELYAQGRTVAFIEFNGKGSTHMNWFDKNRVLNSSWFDMRKGGQFNHFSITREARHGRHFFINKSYHGCPKDWGWFVVMDASGSKPCLWERQKSYPQFLYSKDAKVTRWQSMKYGRAEVLNIYIKRA